MIKALVLVVGLMTVACTASTVVSGGEMRTATVAYQIDRAGGDDTVSVVMCHRFGSPPCVRSQALGVTSEGLREWMKDAELRVIRMSQQQQR